MTDASLQKIAATYGTPTFVFDTDALQARVRAIQAIWGREIDLCYSIKANPFLLPAMMQVTARLEVCSPGELSLCESLHAADARVIYSGVNKTPVDIARAVADGACDKGIVICTTGIGVSIAANKVKGIRCALCTDSLQAEMTRRHNDANMMALGAGITGGNLAKRMVEIFLNTEFEGGRHARRVALLDAIQ